MSRRKSLFPRRMSPKTKLKRSISRSTGIPFTKSGRQKKLGKALGCCVPIAFFISILSTAIAILFA